MNGDSTSPGSPSSPGSASSALAALAMGLMRKRATQSVQNSQLAEMMPMLLEMLKKRQRLNPSGNPFYAPPPTQILPPQLSGSAGAGAIPEMPLGAGATGPYGPF